MPAEQKSSCDMPRGIIWLALVGQNRLVLAPVKVFAIGVSESD
ncbi:MAG: hypothetical protein ACXU9B_01660 [Reyranella sp.]